MSTRPIKNSFIFIFTLQGCVEKNHFLFKMGSEMQPFVETPPKVVEPNRYSHRSIETLVVVIAVITIAGVITGMIARLCGGRHFGGNG